MTATNPASLRWYQIKTPNFKLLYPLGFETQAQRMANTLEGIRGPEGKTIGSVPRRITVILQNQSAISNAFVSTAPRRSEFYAMPSQNYNFVGNNDWLNMLATHEYRHMAQFQHAKRGFNKALFYVFGYNTFAGLSYAAAPQWFWEGDAVVTETAFTTSGRGRIPNFDLVFRTNLMEGRTFNYHKQYLQSYKNFIPDYYKLGFHMVSYLRKKTNDPNIWDKVTARSWNVPFIPFRFSSALKMETGLYVKDLYNEMASSLQKDWKAQQDTLQLTTFEKVNSRASKSYTDYMYPQEMEDGSILVRKSGIGDIEQLIVFKNGNEKRIFTQGVINEAGMLSAANGRIVWNEYRFDPRWQVRTYSVIAAYDTGGVRVIGSNKSRYAAAALSPDGARVATVETTTEYQTRLVVLDYISGRVLQAFENPDNGFISMPRWTTDGKEIVALLTNKKGKVIVKFDFVSGRMTSVTDFSQENIGHPVPFGEYILYNSPVSGIDNVYALDTKSGSRFQITCSKYGAYNPMVSKDGKWIYYNDQARDGMDVVKIPFNPPAWKSWTNRDQPQASFRHLLDQEGHPTVLDNLPSQQYQSKRYHRGMRMINPYSWGGTVSTSLTSAFAGITSQDLLSTTLISAGYAYDKTENTGAWKAAVSYQGWYPIIDFSMTQSDRKVDEGTIETEVLTGTKPNYNSTIVQQDLILKWQEKNIETGLRLPLNTTTSRYFGNITFGNSVGVTQISKSNFNRIIPATVVNDSIYSFYFLSNYLNDGNLIFNHFSVTAYRLLKQSKRDINSKFGQELFLNVYGTPYGGNYNGSQFSVYGVLFFPGLAKHHSLWGYWGYQNSQISLLSYSNQKWTAINDNYEYQFRNQVPLPRGGLGVSRFQDFYTMSANYTLPVWYPDIALGPLLNVQRVRINGFLDYGYGRSVFNTSKGSRINSQAYTSTGIEVKFDINVMRLLPQLDIGFRYSKGLTPTTSLFEVLIGTINF
ncbi:hypothetical protein WSM22_32100 [Cytophagales bacterium WSM2-2]|nr:hypothetical protein WSM22_32100 [Cytophagales bacterium WSM2-2]